MLASSQSLARHVMRCAVVALLLGSGAVQAFEIDELPVLHRNRVKPFAVAANESLIAVTNRGSWKDADGQRWGATELALDALVRPGYWAQQAVVAIDFLPLREALGLSERRVSLAALAVPEVSAVLSDSLARDRERRTTGRVVTWSRVDDEALQLLGRIRTWEAMLHGEQYSLVPLVHTAEQADWALGLRLGQPARAWQVELLEAQADWARSGEHYPSALAFMQERRIWLDLADLALRPDPLLTTRPDSDTLLAVAAAFGAAPTDATAAQPLAEHLHALGADLPHYPTTGAITSELRYIALKPFTWTWICYFLGGLLTAVAMVRLPGQDRVRTGWLLAGMVVTTIGVLWNVVGFGYRLSISPWGAVTNLYETVVYVALVVAVLGLGMALRYRKPIYALAGGFGAGLCALVGQVMPPDLGQHIGPLQPVLRSQFWLWVHVKVIVASYGAFLLAWVLGNVALSRAAWKREAVSAAMGQIIYRCLQIGVVLIIAGTLLGAVWADQAWGRFWGWDPKEVWALVVILVYLIPLHLRLIGAVRASGLAAWSVYGFGAVIFSWYGVNFLLGAGLHSYGFGTGGQGIVLSLCAAQLALTTVQVWRVRRAVPAPRTADSGASSTATGDAADLPDPSPA